MTTVGMHGAPFVAFEWLAVFQPFVQGELGASILERLWRCQILLQHIPLCVFMRDKSLQKQELVQWALNHHAECAAARAAGRLPLQPSQDFLFGAGDGLLVIAAVHLPCQNCTAANRRKPSGFGTSRAREQVQQSIFLQQSTRTARARPVARRWPSTRVCSFWTIANKKTEP